MGFRFTDFGFQVKGFGFQVKGFGFQVKGFGLKGLGFRDKGLELQVYEFMVQGLEHTRTRRKILLSGDPLRSCVAVGELRFWQSNEEILLPTTCPSYGDLA